MTASGRLESLPYTFKEDRYSSHALIAQFIRRQAPDDGSMITVLDVGCAAGFLRAYLPESRFYLIGVDINAEGVESAKEVYDEVYLADISTTWSYPIKHQPQVIVFGDILEHLPYPQHVLKNILDNHAGPSGVRVIVSLPNIAHLYVRLNLLMGRFEYAEKGILDRTHLRFFTKRTAARLLQDCGIAIEALRATPVPLPLISPLFSQGQWLHFLHVLNNASAQLMKALLAYQFVFEGNYEHHNQ